MLKHARKSPLPPKRVVILGATGFVGSVIGKRLEADGIAVLGLGSKDIDLAAGSAAEKLAAVFEPEDALVLVSAIAPCKDPPSLLANIAMGVHVCAAIKARSVDHVLYVGSDAVYADDISPLSESSPTAPSGLHGAMHLAREIMLREAVDAPLAILRPSVLYGAGDPHNGYGPNRFRRLAAKGETITLFGEGEEMRDHVCVDDVAEVALLCLLHRSAGILNVATGAAASFRDVAEMVAGHFDKPAPVMATPRQMPVTHRHFDVTERIRAFPGLSLTPLEEGLARVHREEAEGH
jgi:nucleoside-diphosphate-sugar epimerase